MLSFSGFFRIAESERNFDDSIISFKVDEIAVSVRVFRNGNVTICKRDDSYSYLLRMHIQSMTATKVKELQKK